MKTKLLIIGAFASVLGLSACQTKTSKTGADDTSSVMSDSTHMGMGTAMGSGMMGARQMMMDNMHSMQMTGNVDHDFAMMMISHHQGAIDMAKAELSSGQDDSLKQMAQKMITNQEAEQKELQQIIDSYKNPVKSYDPAKKDAGFAKVMDQNMTMMMDMPKADETRNTDQQFANMMIPHHQSAIFMSEGYIKHGKDPKLLSMAKKMISDQQKEIEDLKKWNDSHP